MTSDADIGSFSAEFGAALRKIAEAADGDSLAVFRSVAGSPRLAAAAAAARRGDIDRFNLELSPIDKTINGLLMSALPDARDAHFLFRQSQFVERHYRYVIQKVEGPASCADKSRNVMRALFAFLTTGAEIVFDHTQDDTFNQPTKVFVNHAEIVNFFDALKRFYYGDPASYLRALDAIAARRTASRAKNPPCPGGQRG